MNSRILWVLIPLMTLCLRATGQALVSQFGPANYEGWTYENNGGIELNANNINIPFPQRDLHIIREN